jgi:SAM-dependent methyltransferase
VGAGQGWAIEYLRRKYPTMQATAIERWEPCRIYIRDRLGATVFDVDLDAPWPEELRGRFDLVILRHTLEHLTEPRQALENITAALAPGGATYIVVPNALRIRAGMAMRTDFFRPVHLHYFNEHTFRRITERAGLTPRSFAAESELWGLFGRAEAGTRDGAARNTHDEQRSLLTRRLAESAWQDRRTIARAYLRHAARVATSLAKSLRTGSRATT